MNYQVYTLADPRTNIVRYVGYTGKKLEARLKTHLNDRERNHRTFWISSLRADGLLPKIELIEAFESKEEALEAERYWIAICKYQFGFDLVNGTDGGECFTLSEAARKKLSQSHRGKRHTEATKRKMSETQKGKMFSEETRLRMSETRKRLGLRPPSSVGRRASEETKRKMSETQKRIGNKPPLRKKQQGKS
jgi:predicted GIY-YIG superfamily endonuclease